jgi:hypothetical protein
MNEKDYGKVVYFFHLLSLLYKEKVLFLHQLVRLIQTKYPAASIIVARIQSNANRECSSTCVHRDYEAASDL